MLRTLISTVVFLAAAVSARALTNADLAPSALVGKTLTFTVVNGGAPYATTGHWSGTFAASGDAFDAKNVDGDFVDISTTYTASQDGAFTNISVAEFVAGMAPATITLYVDSATGEGRYEAFISGVFGVSLNGTFIIGAPVVTPDPQPEIRVERAGGANLKDGKNVLAFGGVKKGESSTIKLVVKNTGDAPLKRLAVTTKGASGFTVTGLAKKSLAAGKSITLRVKFSPKKIGKRKGTLQILSNDKNEGVFDVSLRGTAE